MNEKIKYGFILGTICLLAGGILSGVNALTQPQIKMQMEKEEGLALKKVFPEAGEFNPRSKDGHFLYYGAMDNSGKLMGFILKVSGQGYSSQIEVLAGLNLKLEVADLVVISQSETPGLGTRVMEDDFRGQFKGKTMESLDQVQAIAGATISSQAVISSVKNKIQELEQELLQEISNAG